MTPSGNFVTPPAGADLKCPTCGEPLRVRPEPGSLRFACLRGHHFTREQIAGPDTARVLGILEAALNAVEERTATLRRIVQQARKNCRLDIAASFQRDLDDLESRRNALEDIVHAFRPPGGSPA